MFAFPFLIVFNYHNRSFFFLRHLKYYVETKLIRKHIEGFRECFVVIEVNFGAMCQSWLDRRRPIRPSWPIQQLRQNAIPTLRAPQNVIADPVRPVVPSNAAAAVPAFQIGQRRSSVASCRNLFEIDGKVDEVGFDHLHHVKSAPAVVCNNANNVRLLHAGFGAIHDNDDNDIDMSNDNIDKSIKIIKMIKIFQA